MSHLESAGITAKRLGISPHTLSRWTRDRRIPFVRLGRRVLYDPSTIDRWVLENTIAPLSAA